MIAITQQPLDRLGTRRREGRGHQNRKYSERVTFAGGAPPLATGGQFLVGPVDPGPGAWRRVKISRGQDRACIEEPAEFRDLTSN